MEWFAALGQRRGGESSRLRAAANDILAHQMLSADVNPRILYFADSMGLQQQFVSAFIGKSGAPRLGPHGIAHAGGMDLYVGDGDGIWRITRAAPVPESGTVASLPTGVLTSCWLSLRQ